MEAKKVSAYIEDRVIETAEYIIKTKKDIRTIAKKMGVSKTTVYKDLRDRLPVVNPEIALEVDTILKDNKYLGCLLGGEKTRLKYENQKLKCKEGK